jgi:cellulose synthase/poly-beta-1,6-N-acetylglucosamine synthase-like glycosyltransferase
MKISFVIPARNEETYLGDCLKTIIKERETGRYEMEVIVVNNVSTDGTRKLAEGFSGVKVIDEPKKGLVQARQAGYLASSGDLIANVDADTRLTPGWVNKVLEEFSKDEKLVALSGPFIYYDLSKFKNLIVKIFFGFGAVSNFIGQRIFHGGAILQGGNFVLRRMALDKIGGYNMNLTFWGEDADVAFRINKIGKVKFIMSLPIYSSGRRIKAGGVIRIGLLSLLDNVWISVFRKPFRKGEYTIK